MKILPVILVAALILTSTSAVSSADGDNRISSVVVSAQTGAVTYGTGGAVTYVVTVNRRTGYSGSFSASLSQTATLPSGAVATFVPKTLSFASGDASKTSTLTITTAGSTKAGATEIKVKASTGDDSSVRGTGTLSIDKAPLTVTANDDAKTYDARAYTRGNGVTYSGFVLGQASSVLSGTLTYDAHGGINVGSYAITPGGLTSSNYAITFVNGTLAIGPAVAAVRANDKSKIYGALNPALNATVTGAVSGGDPIGYSLATTATQFSGVAGGPYPITVSLGANPNYTVTGTDGALTIQAAAASVRANDKSKTYGFVNPTLDATVTGAVAGGDAIDFSLNTTAAQFSAVAGGPHPITVSLGPNPNYTVTVTHGALTILRAVATVKANDKSRPYGSANPALDASVTGAVTGGDPISFSLATTATQLSDVAGGPYPISVTLASNPNYSVTATNGALTIQRAVATMTISNKSKTYGQPNPLGDGTISGEVPGGPIQCTITITTTATQFSPVGQYPITGTVTGPCPNYVITIASGTLTIQPAPATVAANNKSKVYGGANPTLNATVTGEVPGGDAINYTLATIATQFSGVTGSPYAINVILGSNPNYNVTVVNGALTITRAPATVNANSKSKPYGQPNPVFDAIVTGAVPGGDPIRFTLGTTAGQFSGVMGSPYPIVVTLDANPNYNIVPTNGALTIIRASATVRANDKSKVYGQANPLLDATETGEVPGGEPLNYMLTTTAVQLSGVPGSPYTITVTVGPNPNYIIVPTNGALTITRAPATVAANDKGKTYGQVNPALDAAETGAVKGGDPISYSLSTTAAQYSGVAGNPYPISVALGSNPNYDVTATNGTLTINRAQATVEANDKSKTYGEQNPVLDATVTGEVESNAGADFRRVSISGVGGGDPIEYALTTTAEQFSDVADSPYPITVTLGKNPNYDVTPMNGALTIGAALATIKANNKSRPYGDPNPTLDAVVTGEVPGGDRINYSLSTVATHLSAVAGSPYPIDVTLGSNPNYSVKVLPDNGTVTVLRRLATVTANDESRAYGENNPTFDATETGEVPDGVPLDYTLGTAATPVSGVPGSPYPITVTLGPNPNYDVTATSGALAVQPAMAWVKANPKTKLYGAVIPVLDATVTGEVQGGDPVRYNLSTPATPLSGVPGNPYAIEVTIGSNPNYSVKVPADNGTLTVLPAPATVTADDKSKTYGAVIPTLTATETGEVPGGDPINYTLVTTATPLSGVPGPYPITVNLGTNPNYTVTPTNGALTIEPAMAWVKANPKTKLYGAAIPVLDATVTGEVQGGDRVNYSLRTPATPLSGVAGNPYAIEVTIGSNPNYSVKVPADNGTLTVEPAPATVTADDKDKTYGAEVPTLTATETGEVEGGDPINYDLATTATRLSGVPGPYPITVELGSNPNYTVTTTDGGLTVQPAMAWVKANPKTKIYGAAIPTLDATVTGEVPGGDPVRYTLSTPATPLSGVPGNPYPIEVTIGSNPNYSVKVPADNGTLTVQPQPASVTANPKTKFYGAAIPTLDATVTGEVSGGDRVQYTLNTTATPLSGVPGPYPITVVLGTNPNYNVTATNGLLAVSPALATVKANAKSKAYGADVPALDATVTGEVQGGDRVNYTLGTTATRLSNVVTSPYAINVTLGSNPNYSVKVPADNGTLTVVRAVATVSANNKSKVYGGLVPVLDATETGEVSGGDPLNYAVTTTALPLSNVGSHPITVTLGANPNYDVTPTNGTLTIQAALATVAANNKSKAYGAPLPVLDATVTGEVSGGDRVLYTLSTTAAPLSNVSLYPITVAPGVNPNYTVSVTHGGLLVQPAIATVEANNKSKTYGQSNPTLDAAVTGEVSGGDLIQYTLATTATPLSNVADGPFPIVVTLGLNPNYSVTPTNGALTVNRAPATVTVNDKSKTYGDPNPPLTATGTGPVAADDAVKYGLLAAGGPAGDPISFTLFTPATQCSGVGSYPITVILGPNPNYIVTATNGTLTIQARPVTVTANDKSRIYGDANPLLDATVNNAAIGCDPVLFTLATTALQLSNIGPYPITVTPGSNPNYTVTLIHGTLTALARPLAVTADAKTKVYGGGDPELTYRITSGTLVGTDAFSGALIRVTGESVAGGPYAINQGTLSLGDNYALSYVAANLAISPAMLTVTAHAQSKVYGESDPALGYAVTGFQFSDQASTVLTGELSRAAGEAVLAGPYAIGRGTLASNTNYTIGFNGNDLVITPRPITVAAVPKVKKFGAPDPPLTYVITVGSLAFNDAFTGSLGRASGENVHEGPYPISQSTLVLNANYVLTFVGANLVIGHAQAATTLTFTPDPQQYSDLVEFTATVQDGFANGLQALNEVAIRIGSKTVGTIPLVPSGSSLTGSLSVALLESGAAAPGTYTVTCVQGPGNDNFTVEAAAPSTLTISREDARAAFTGATFASTTNTDDDDNRAPELASASVAASSSRRATVTLSATIRDITATGDAAGDASFGDIRNATVTFVDRGNGDAVIATVPVGLVSAGDTKTGTATYDWSVSIGSAASKQFTVGTIVNGYYTRNSADDNIVVTVSRPLASTATGIGHLVLANPAGIYPGDVNSKADFDFNVAYDGSERLSGSVKTTVRNAGKVYQIRSTVMTSLAVQPGGTASFTGKARVRDITNPNSPKTIDSDATVQVTMADLGTPGTADEIAITAWNADGGLWFASSWSGTGTVQQVLGGGDLQVSGGSLLASTLETSGAGSGRTSELALASAGSSEPAGSAIPLQYAFPQNYPNPFTGSTTIRFELPQRSKVSLVIYDVMGREVASLVDGAVDPGFHVETWSGRSREGQPAAAGVYFVRMVATSLNGAGGLRSDRRIVLVK